jgi:hypothetical protein
MIAGGQQIVLFPGGSEHNNRNRKVNRQPDRQSCLSLARFRTVAERQIVAVVVVCEEYPSSDGAMAAAWRASEIKRPLVGSGYPVDHTFFKDNNSGEVS